MKQIKILGCVRHQGVTGIQGLVTSFVSQVSIVLTSRSYVSTGLYLRARCLHIYLTNTVFSGFQETLPTKNLPFVLIVNVGQVY